MHSFFFKAFSPYTTKQNETNAYTYNTCLCCLWHIHPYIFIHVYCIFRYAPKSILKNFCQRNVFSLKIFWLLLFVSSIFYIFFVVVVVFFFCFLFLYQSIIKLYLSLLFLWHFISIFPSLNWSFICIFSPIYLQAFIADFIIGFCCCCTMPWNF